MKPPLLIALVGLILLGANATGQESPPASFKALEEAPAPNALEAYRRKCMQIVGQRWKRIVDQTKDKSVFTGHVKIAFQILPEGRPKHYEVLEQSADADALRRTALFATAMSRFDPIPADALKLLDGKPLRIEAAFTLGSR